MRRWAKPLIDIETASPEVAFRLVDTLFGQIAPLVVGAGLFMIFGLVGYIGTGSYWYLAGSCYTFSVFLWRYWQTRLYKHARHSATPVSWAWRAARSSWASAAGWGAWSGVVIFEPEKSIIVLLIGIHAGLVSGGVLRNCAVPLVALGQINLALIPLFFACLGSANPYLEVYAAIVVFYLVTMRLFIENRHAESMQLALKEQETSDLVSRLATANQMLEMANLELESLATTDALTNVANRRAFDHFLASEWRRAARDETCLALLMLDIDHFKPFNDLYGHQRGDACLRDVAAAIGTALRRPGDMLARYGGEEFAVVLPGAGLDDAVQVAQQMLEVLHEQALPHDASPFGRVTASIGIASMVPQPDTTFDRLVERADAALYTAKRNGRNRSHAADASFESGSALASLADPASALE